MENKKYKVEFGNQSIEGNFNYVVKKLRNEYGQPLRTIAKSLQCSHEWINLYCVNNNIMKHNKYLTDKAFLLAKTDEQIKIEYGFPLNTIKRARINEGLTRNCLCGNMPVSLHKRRHNFTNNIFGLDYEPGKEFVFILKQTLFNHNGLLSRKNKNLLLDFYIFGKNIEKTKRRYKYTVMKKAKKVFNQKPVDYWIKNNFIRIKK
jgi:hypothetical protein